MSNCRTRQTSESMAFLENFKVVNFFHCRAASTRVPYEIPERYRESFYLANAAFFDSTNWFLHRAYEYIFPSLKKKLQELEPKRQYTDDEIVDKVEDIVKVLDQCNSIVDVRFPVKKDNGSHEVVRGFRAHHGLGIGYAPCLGGFRIDENITRDHMKALSVLATYRNACMGINMAGAHGGLKICPTNYSTNELHNIINLYTAELIKRGYCCEKDVAQPDINTSEREMSWMVQACAKCTGQVGNVSAMGKPPDYGGIENYEKMACQGALFALDFFLNDEAMMKKVALTRGLQEKTFIIQGLGKLGAPLAQLLVNNGAICVGVKENDAYIYDAKGIDLKELYEHRTNTGSIRNFGPCKADINDSIYTERCDVLIFAAHHKSLNCYVANSVKAKVVLEAAEGPMSPMSHKILSSRAKLVIPDIYACSGGTIASYIEYLRNMQQIGVDDRQILRFSRNIYGDILKRMSEKQHKMAMIGSSTERVNSVVISNILLDSVEYILTEIGNEIKKILDMYRLDTDLRTAAYMVSIDNIFNTLYYQRKFI